MSDPLQNTRKDYAKFRLTEDQIDPNPFKQLNAWLKAAQDAGLDDYNAMALATVGLDGTPQSRIVLLRGVDHGLQFFTNYTSDKGRELTACPKCSVMFFWPTLERQVRVSAMAEKLPPAASDAYFESRPRASQIGAWVSDQSQPIPHAEALEAKVLEMENRFEGAPVPRPDHWGGFRLIPSKFEFWQGRPSRLHDRLVYVPSDSTWSISRIQP